MDNMSFEFDVKLEKVPLSPRAKNKQEFAKVPNIRKYLLLAHQIEQLTEDSSDISLKKISDWLGVTYPRIKQITALLFLFPPPDPTCPTNIYAPAPLLVEPSVVSYNVLSFEAVIVTLCCENTGIVKMTMAAISRKNFIRTPL